jgi:hypothetical protein
MEQNERHEKKIREGRKKEKELRQKNKDILSRAEEEIQYLSLEKLVIEYLLFFLILVLIELLSIMILA